MSLLLDALNKADQERKRREMAPSINSNHERTIESNHRPTPVVAITTGLSILIIILLVIVYWLWQRSAVSTEIATQSTAKNSAVIANESAENSNSLKALPTLSPSTQVPSATAQPRVSNTQVLEQVDAHVQAENVANLYQQNTNSNIKPYVAPTNVNTPVSVEPQSAPNSITQFANLPELHDLPNSELEKIPSLNYSQHNYNINGGSVVINGTVKHVNDQINGGIVIDKILEDGMILHIDNYSFKMRALNSWINM